MMLKRASDCVAVCEVEWYDDLQKCEEVAETEMRSDRPLKAGVAGSNPVGATKNPSSTARSPGFFLWNRPIFALVG